MTPGILYWHLKTNIYPPIEEHVIPYIHQAIEAFRAGDENKVLLDVPEEVTAYDLVSDLCLWDFVEAGEE